jgi:cysteine desulfurase
MKHRIYLDNNATTQLDTRVIDVVVDDLKNHFGNPSSIHFFGQDSRNRLTKAKQIIANYFHVKAQELIFTSGGTESLNTVIRGLFSDKSKGHIVTSNVEHSCVYSSVKYLEQQGCTATYLSPGPFGAVSVKDVENALKPETRLIVLMAVNNETGVMTEIEAIAAFAQARGIPFVVDGIALLGKELFLIPQGVSAMCFSGHKIHAPKGVGLTVLRSKMKVNPLILGGEQENGRRAGTENLSGIIGFAEAIRLLTEELPNASHRMQILRDKLERSLIDRLPGVHVNGLGPRVSNTTNLAFSGLEGEALITALDMEGVAVSHGSACSSGALEPSRVLLNMGLSTQVAGSSLRFSLSRFTTEEEIDTAINVICKVVLKMRSLTKGD